MKSSDMKIFALIPALNEEESIGKVVSEIPKELIEEVVVIDNGSGDMTVKNAKDAGATVLSQDIRGYGHALMKGIEYAGKKDADILLFLDGDYSDFPSEAPMILKPILEGKADLVIGSRVLGKSEKGALLPQARFGNWLSTTLIRIFWKVKFTDLGPFRAVPYKILVDMNMEELTYGWTVEMQIKAAKSGLRCVEVPVSYRKRIGKSKVTGTISGSIKAGIGILSTIFRILLKGK